MSLEKMQGLDFTSERLYVKVFGLYPKANGEPLKNMSRRNNTYSIA